VQLKESTRVRYEGLLRGHVLPKWGSVPLAKIGHADVAAWVAGLSASDLSGSTIRQAHRVFSLLLALAVRDGRLTRNPAEGVKLPRANKVEKTFLTHEQVNALAEVAGKLKETGAMESSHLRIVGWRGSGGPSSWSCLTAGSAGASWQRSRLAASTYSDDA
jgi:site-specific recombinase XerD